MALKEIRINDRKITYLESPGKGPSALLIHGNSLSSKTFSHQIKGPIGEKFRLVALDLPGHGGSEPAKDPESTYSLPGYARSICEAARTLGLDDAVLVGHSLGGHIVLEAIDDIEEARGVMIFGAPPIGFPPPMDRAFLPHPIFETLFKVVLTQEESLARATVNLGPGATEYLDMVNKDVRNTHGEARKFLGESIGAGLYADEVRIVAELRVPIAVIHGTEDPLVNPAYFASLEMPTLWRDEVQMMKDIGHLPQLEAPGEFDKLLGAFIEELS